MHANNGATDARGTAVPPIYGPALDGSLPGNEIILAGMTSGRPAYARAIGPMQFLPGTWARCAGDGKGDGEPDPQNISDAALTAARYLCSGGLNLHDQSQLLSAILRYNNSIPYAQNVLGWAGAYATGVMPMDMPPIMGPAPPMGDAYLEDGAHNVPEGLGPGLPIGLWGLATTDPMAQLSSVYGPGPGVQLPSVPWDPAVGAGLSDPQPPLCAPLCYRADGAAPGMAPAGAAPNPFAASPLPSIPAAALPGTLAAAPLPGPLPAAPLPASRPGAPLPGPPLSAAGATAAQDSLTPVPVLGPAPGPLN